jgi:hypothetical protein
MPVFWTAITSVQMSPTRMITLQEGGSKVTFAGWKVIPAVVSTSASSTVTVFAAAAIRGLPRLLGQFRAEITSRKRTSPIQKAGFASIRCLFSLVGIRYGPTVAVGGAVAVAVGVDVGGTGVAV